jgi:hypothetical protein
VFVILAVINTSFYKKNIHCREIWTVKTNNFDMSIAIAIQYGQQKIGKGRLVSDLRELKDEKIEGMKKCRFQTRKNDKKKRL